MRKVKGMNKKPAICRDRLLYKDLEKLNNRLWNCIKSRDATIIKQSKKTEEAWRWAVHWKRAYVGLYGMKQAAEAMGIDTENPELTEEEEKYNREHDLEVDTKQFESGKVKAIFKPVKKKDKLN